MPSSVALHAPLMNGDAAVSGANGASSHCNVTSHGNDAQVPEAHLSDTTTSFDQDANEVDASVMLASVERFLLPPRDDSCLRLGCIDEHATAKERLAAITYQAIGRASWRERVCQYV